MFGSGIVAALVDSQHWMLSPLSTGRDILEQVITGWIESRCLVLYCKHARDIVALPCREHLNLVDEVSTWGESTDATTITITLIINLFDPVILWSINLHTLSVTLRRYKLTHPTPCCHSLQHLKLDCTFHEHLIGET